jgi:phosphoribosylformimino-5-aminoimidazole carboxamide ribotide isomerase
MTGLPLEAVLPLRQSTSKQLIVAGGIATFKEIEHLDQLGIDAVVGMALYSGRLTLPDTIPISK